MTKFTKKAITETFVSMVEKRCIDEITVSELTKECGINRNTFYYHYSDIFAVLSDVFEQQVILATNSEKRGDMEADLCEALSLMKRHKDFVNHVYYSSARDIFIKYLNTTMDKLTETHFQFYYDEYALSPEKQKFSTHIISLVLRSFVIEWIRNSYDIPVEKLAHTTSIIFDSIIDNTLDTLKNKL
ncbi:MAG: TetR/AcrR family transcriptional regulator C-terminal domain-containing protein [Lachnospiraceae bacterium]|nr:TetR/AcrR family transcriptional regulator C-terminal domain-containing protein [Lachnospiraceae bacterium]